MDEMTATEVRRNTGRLFEAVKNNVVNIKRKGKVIAVALSPEAYGRLWNRGSAEPETYYDSNKKL